MIHSEIGLVHVLAATAALVFGTWVLLGKKGSRKHKTIGYAYVLSMGIMLATAFGIYDLFGKWGIFHYMAVLSTLTLVFGMYPALQKPISPGRIYRHFTWMYWSVIGLYAAFASEMLTRVPAIPFFGMVGLATFAIIAAGGFIFGLKKKKWKNEFL